MDDYQSCMRLHKSLSTQGRAALAGELRRDPATSAQSYADLAVGLGQRHDEYEDLQRSDSVQDAREKYLRLFYTPRLEPELVEPPPSLPPAQPPETTDDNGDDDQSEEGGTNDEGGHTGMEEEGNGERAVEKYAKLAHRMRGSKADYDAVMRATTEEQARKLYTTLMDTPEQPGAVENSLPPVAVEPMAGAKPKTEAYNAAGRTVMGVVSVVCLLLLCMLFAMFSPFGQSVQSTTPAADNDDGRTGEEAGH